MGIAATQARYLGLTARKTNIEFEGQQVNQQRTTLATESSNLFQKLYSLDVPVVPSSSDYTKTTYTYNDDTYKIISYKTSSTEKSKYDVTVRKNSATKNETHSGCTLTFSSTSSSSVSNIQSIIDPQYSKEETLSVTTSSDEEAYEEAMTKYQNAKAHYDQEMNRINAETEKIQSEDRSLELRLRQLDTEQQTLMVELDSLKSVLDKNIDKVFKVFA